MPFTILHHPLAYFLYKFDKKLSLPGLIVGSMFPDLEIPFIVLLFGTEVPHRMVLHSLLGSVTLGTVLALIFTVKLYPPIVSRLFHVDRQKIADRCKLSFALVFSVFLGNLSHVLLDITNHPYNPLFWPFRPTSETASLIYFALGEPLGYLLAQIVMGTLLVVLIIVKRRNLFEELLVG